MLLYEGSDDQGGPDRHEDATAVAQEILDVNPNITAELALGLIRAGDYLSPTRIAQATENLRKAGLP